MEDFKLNPVKDVKSNASKNTDNFQSGFDKVFGSFGNNNADVVNKIKNTANTKTAETTPVDNNVPANPKKEELEITQNDVLASHKKGYEEGYSKGYSDAKTESEKLNIQINDTVKNIDGQLKQILEVRKFEDLKKSEDVIDLALKVARKVSDKTISENACQLVENVIVKSFEILFDEPRLLICVNSQVIDDINNRIENLVKSEGFGADVEVVASENIGVGDCKIQWQGGGLITDREAVWKDIEAMLQ